MEKGGKAFSMSGYIMAFDDFVRGCAPCLELGGAFVSPYWGVVFDGMGKGGGENRGRRG